MKMGCASSTPVAPNEANYPPQSASAPSKADASAAAKHIAARRITAYYNIGETLGKGGFGEVKTCTRKSDNTLCVHPAQLLPPA